MVLTKRKAKTIIDYGILWIIIEYRIMDGGGAHGIELKRKRLPNAHYGCFSSLHKGWCMREAKV